MPKEVVASRGPPLVVDREPSAQEKCLQLVQEALIDGIVPLNKSNGDNHKLTWSLLKKLTDPSYMKQVLYDVLIFRRIYLRKACSLWARQKFFKASLMKSLISHLESEHEESVWMLLSVITPFYKSWICLPDRVWREKSVMTKTNQSPLDTHPDGDRPFIRRFAERFCHDLQEDLGKRLMSFEDDLPLIAAVLEALCKVRK
ncbi:putative condensin-2 complex subunit D3-like isoform X2 [Apostichopus japonicus]|uniref:Putative condensin-2 complex subunit D3-like isoform X2 n=1 Tax=Stichopus japonicus TaxID=307972 RepID=A0A2G8KAS2_STIJA|nr:putative condensin-2 complex subunit D3-like isoform X2 [Apostichopus japonicus]